MINFKPRLSIYKSVERRAGYTVGERVTRTVTLIHTDSNGRVEQLTMKDENGVLLLWQTSPENKVARKMHGVMTVTFLVKDAVSGTQHDTPKIRISHVAIEPRPKGVVRDGGR